MSELRDAVGFDGDREVGFVVAVPIGRGDVRLHAIPSRGRPVYLEPGEARKLGRALLTGADEAEVAGGARRV